MTKKLRDRDWQDLSAYLDGQLSSRERARLEKDLVGSEDLRVALEDLRRVRILLKSQPRLRAPRNFTLTPKLVGIPERRPPARQLTPVFGLVSALASVLLILVLAGEFLLGAGPAAPIPAAYQAKSVEVEMAAAPTQIPPVEVPALPAAEEQAPTTNDQRSMAPQPTQMAGEAGAMEYPAPMVLESSPSGYPPPAESATGVQGLQVTPTLSSTPVPTQEALAVSQSDLAQQEEPVVGAIDVEAKAQAQPALWNTWRVFEVSLLFLAIISGATALLLRRRREK